jgi:hypothetical protein
MTGARVGLGLSRPAAVALALLALAAPAGATIRYGAAQISGNLESQQLFRLDRSRSETFEAFDLVQQRNTFRIQYEHDVVQGGRFLDLFDVGLFESANLFFYYRLVYDSVYDLAPGPFFRSQEGGKAGSFDSIPGSARTDVALENVIREAFVDLDLAHAPVSFRIGRQQIVWGNTVNFRALDSVNALDLSWHLQQEAGILGKVGFSELRIPSWAIKALWNVGSIGPVADVYLEAYDIPFEFQTTEVAFLPKPWSVNVRNPFRAGLAIEAAPGVVLQPCFDRTGLTETNDAARAAGHAPDFDDTARTGLCDAEGLRRSTLRRGLYDPHDPADVNQFGARLGGNVSDWGLGIALAYMHRRHITDATGGAAAKAHAGLVESNQLGFVELDALRNPLAPTHDSTDPLTGETTSYVGYVRIPVEFYFPYVNVFGLSLDYFDSWTSAVYNVEVAASQGVPIASVDDPRGLRRTWEMEMALLVYRPTWIRPLNPRSTWNVLAQLSASFLPFHEDGDVGVPNSETIPGQFGDGTRLDRRRQVEMLSIFAMQTFYWGGSLSPLVSMVVDWSNAPAFSWQAFLQYLPRPDVIIEPGVRIFWTDGRVVDDRYQVSKNAGRSEFQLKLTYQY